MHGGDLQAGFVQPFFDVLHAVAGQIYRQKFHRIKSQGLDGLELFQQGGAEAQEAGDAAEGISTDTKFHKNILLNVCVNLNINPNVRKVNKSLWAQAISRAIFIMSVKDTWRSWAGRASPVTRLSEMVSRARAFLPAAAAFRYRA